MQRGPVSPGTSPGTLATADKVSAAGCSFSVDGLIWYALPAGVVPPFDYAHLRCPAAATLSATAQPPIPSWAIPQGPTQSIFIATSLQESYSLGGMQTIARLAHGAAIPVTWMVGNPQYLTRDAQLYDTFHAVDGDDVQLEDQNALYQLAATTLPWFAPAVSVEGAGHERKIGEVVARGEHGFWGITWNSDGTDRTADRGAPWGTYCADTSSYKRPAPSGVCNLVSFEWTARDLTRAYLSPTALEYSAEAEYSTDPDDLLRRGGFTPAAGAAYERHLVDAYAAAGEMQPLVMMSQQESIDEAATPTTDDVVLGALYDEVGRDHVQALTLAAALPAAQTFSNRPRAIAFPFIAGGNPELYNGAAFFPATIDYHDDKAGMSFTSGHTLPARLFPYVLDPVSTFNHQLVEIGPGAGYPQLTRVAAASGALIFHFNSPAAMHFGVAVWTDPRPLGLGGSNVAIAGRAGFVAAFDLPQGESDQTVPCAACSTTTFAYSV